MERPDFIHRSGNDDFAGGGRRMELFKTIAGPASTPYPEEGDPEAGTQPTVYYAQMVKQVRYSAIPGVRTLQYSLTNYKTHVFNLASETYIEEGSVVAAWEMGGQWYTIDKVPPSDVDYVLLTNTLLLGFQWNRDNPTWSVAHGMNYGSTGGRKQMVTDDDFVYIAGPAGSTGAIRKYNKRGELVSTVTYQATANNPNGFAIGPDGNFVLSGTFAGPTEHVRKVAPDGTRIWGYNQSNMGQLDIDGDGNILVVRTLGAPFLEVMKLDASGSITWISGTTDIGASTTYFTPRFDLEGNVLLGDLSAPFLPPGRLSKFDPDGNLIWTVTAASRMHIADAIAITPENEIITCGRASDLTNASRIAKYDVDGNALFSTRIAETSLPAAAVHHDGRVAIAGWHLNPLVLNTSTVSLYNADMTAGGAIPQQQVDRGISIAFFGGLVSQFNP